MSFRRLAAKLARKSGLQRTSAAAVTRERPRLQSRHMVDADVRVDSAPKECSAPLPLTVAADSLLESILNKMQVYADRGTAGFQRGEVQSEINELMADLMQLRQAFVCEAKTRTQVDSLESIIELVKMGWLQNVAKKSEALLRDIRPFDVRKCLEHLRRNEQISAALKDKSCWVFVGPTGAGKTTLIQYLAGSQLAENELGQIFVNGFANPMLASMNAGHSLVASETRHIATVPLTLSKVLDIEDADSSVHLVDTSGFGDSAGAEMQLANGLGLTRCLRQATRVKLIPVFSKHSLEASKMLVLKKTAATLSQMLHNFEETLRNNAACVLTKAGDEYEERQLRADFRQVFEDERVKENRDEAFTFLTEVLSNRMPATCVRPLRSELRKNVLQSIAFDCEWIVSPKRAFQEFVNDEALDKLIQQMEAYKKSISALCQDLDAAKCTIVSELLSLMRQMVEELPNKGMHKCLEDSEQIASQCWDARFDKVQQYTIANDWDTITVEDFAQLFETLDADCQALAGAELSGLMGKVKAVGSVHNYVNAAMEDLLVSLTADGSDMNDSDDEVKYQEECDSVKSQMLWHKPSNDSCDDTLDKVLHLRQRYDARNEHLSVILLKHMKCWTKALGEEYSSCQNAMEEHSWAEVSTRVERAEHLKKLIERAIGCEAPGSALSQFSASHLALVSENETELKKSLQSCLYPEVASCLRSFDAFVPPYSKTFSPQSVDSEAVSRPSLCRFAGYKSFDASKVSGALQQCENLLKSCIDALPLRSSGCDLCSKLRASAQSIQSFFWTEVSDFCEKTLCSVDSLPEEKKLEESMSYLRRCEVIRRCLPKVAANTSQHYCCTKCSFERLMVASSSGMRAVINECVESGKALDCDEVFKCMRRLQKAGRSPESDELRLICEGVEGYVESLKKGAKMLVISTERSEELSKVSALVTELHKLGKLKDAMPAVKQSADELLASIKNQVIALLDKIRIDFFEFAGALAIQNAVNALAFVNKCKPIGWKAESGAVASIPSAVDETYKQLTAYLRAYGKQWNKDMSEALDFCTDVNAAYRLTADDCKSELSSDYGSFNERLIHFAEVLKAKFGELRRLYECEELCEAVFETSAEKKLSAVFKAVCSKHTNIRTCILRWKQKCPELCVKALDHCCVLSRIDDDFIKWAATKLNASAPSFVSLAEQLSAVQIEMERKLKRDCFEAFDNGHFELVQNYVSDLQRITGTESLARICSQLCALLPQLQAAVFKCVVRLNDLFSAERVFQLNESLEKLQSATHALKEHITAEMRAMMEAKENFLKGQLLECLHKDLESAHKEAKCLRSEKVEEKLATFEERLRCFRCFAPKSSLIEAKTMAELSKEPTKVRASMECVFKDKCDELEAVNLVTAKSRNPFARLRIKGLFKGMSEPMCAEFEAVIFDTIDSALLTVVSGEHSVRDSAEGGKRVETLDFKRRHKLLCVCETTLILLPDYFSAQLKPGIDSVKREFKELVSELSKHATDVIENEDWLRLSATFGELKAADPKLLRRVVFATEKKASALQKTIGRILDAEEVGDTEATQIIATLKEVGELRDAFAGGDHITRNIQSSLDRCSQKCGETFEQKCLEIVSGLRLGFSTEMDNSLAFVSRMTGFYARNGKPVRVKSALKTLTPAICEFVKGLREKSSKMDLKHLDALLKSLFHFDESSDLQQQIHFFDGISQCESDFKDATESKIQSSADLIGDSQLKAAHCEFTSCSLEVAGALEISSGGKFEGNDCTIKAGTMVTRGASKLLSCVTEIEGNLDNWGQMEVASGSLSAGGSVHMYAGSLKATAAQLKAGSFRLHSDVSVKEAAVEAIDESLKRLQRETTVDKELDPRFGGRLVGECPLVKYMCHPNAHIKEPSDDCRIDLEQKYAGAIFVIMPPLFDAMSAVLNEFLEHRQRQSPDYASRFRIVGGQKELTASDHIESQTNVLF